MPAKAVASAILTIVKPRHADTLVTMTPEAQGVEIAHYSDLWAKK